MTDIDRAADIEVSRGFAQVTVRIPLTGHVSQEWLLHFQTLAHKWRLTRGTPSPGPAKASWKCKANLTVAGSSSSFPLVLIAP
jgi:hypothetical protein